MRPLLALLMVTSILGGMQWFMASQSRTVERSAPAIILGASGEFSVEVTLSFAAGRDEFAVSDDDRASSVLVQLQGRELLRRTDGVSGEAPLEIKPVPGVVVGGNEFYVQVAPAEAGSLLPHAVRIRVLRDSHPLGEGTLWSEPGGTVQGAIMVQVPP